MKQPTVNILGNGKEDRKREWSVEDNPNFENPRKIMSLKVAFVILVTSSEYYWLYCRVELLIGSDSMLLKLSRKKKISLVFIFNILYCKVCELLQKIIITNTRLI